MTPSKAKVRADRLLVEREIVDSREKAQALILAGQVLVNEQKVAKCGELVSAEVPLRLLGEPPKYVSRGGIKLADALDHFRASPEGKICLDVGASTGGFTDCLLQHGAARVIAVDVGTNQLDWKLRKDPRVTVLEKTNARYLTPMQVGMPVEFLTMDVSFISATMILPILPPLLVLHAEALILVKPQFEVGRGQVGKRGVVRDSRLQQEAVARVSRKLLEVGFHGLASAESCLPGVAGNREFFLHAIWGKSA